MFKRACSRQLEAQLNTLQKDGPAAWAALPEEELFTPAGFSSQQAEATASSATASLFLKKGRKVLPQLSLIHI